MKVTELQSHDPRNGGRIHIGEAISTRGLRYTFVATDSGKPQCVQREEYNEAGQNLFRARRVKPSPTLRAAIRSAVRRAPRAAARGGNSNAR